MKGPVAAGCGSLRFSRVDCHEKIFFFFSLRAVLDMCRGDLGVKVFNLLFVLFLVMGVQASAWQPLALSV